MIGLLHSLGELPVMTRLLNPFRRIHTLVAAASSVPLFVLGVGAIANPSPSHAQQNVPQIRFFDELPPPSNIPSPPPSSSIPTFNVPTSPSPPSLPNTNPPDPVPSEREFNFQAPSSPLPSRRPTQNSNLYRVDIDGDSLLLLSQVRQIEPQAFVRQRDGVIQAGVFADRYNAESRVRVLAAQGIRAQVTAIASSGTPWAIATGTDAQLDSTLSVASDLPQYEVALRGYFVVIPGERSDLPNIAAEVIRLGVTESAVSQREAPRGPHVAIGPFESRKDADRWTNYFRSAGMDARVYFGQ